jgi:predicted Zn finger-like uncharacterized protein
MNDGIVTECPECETRFNVSDGQLKLADGKVRCGACLRVFDARAHQPYSEPAATPADEPDSPAIAHSAVPPGSPARQSEPQQEYSLHVRYAQPSRPEPTVAATVTPPAPEADHSHAADADLSFDPDAPLEVSGAAAPIGSPVTVPTATGAPIHPAQHALAFPEPDAARFTAPSHQPSGTAMPGTAQTAVATPAAAAIPNAADTAAPPEQPPRPNAADTAAPPEQPPRPSAADTAAPPEQPPKPSAADTAAPPEQPPRPSADTLLRGTPALYDLYAEPLELLHPAQPAAPAAVLGWSLGCLFAALLLASQLLWFNRIPWSQQPRLSEFYDILCHQVDCAIPPRQAVELIRNRQLVVRPHAEFQDALSIDLLLENTADFRQPFPAIELRFSDIRGRTVAHRLLQPNDYLDISLNPLKMAYSQPYQVNLAILDPGRRAVSYEVQLAPARL